MISEQEYNKLISISRNKYPNCYEDIVHDAILLGFDYEGCMRKLKELSFQYFTVKDIDLTGNYEEKVCIHCNRSLPIAYFPVYRYSNITSTRNVCNDCINNQKKEWIHNNEEKVKDSRRRYREKNKDKCSELTRNWHKKNPEKAKEYRTKYRENNRDEYLEYSRNWRKNNSEKIKEYKARYHAKKRMEKQLAIY